jgi:hypothetical protein
MASMCAPPRGFMRATARAIDLLLQYAVQNEKKMAVLLILKMAVATVTLHSGYRHYIDRTTAQIPTRSRRTESTTWCGAQTPALSFPHMRISPALLVPLLAISLALLCAAGQVWGRNEGRVYWRTRVTCFVLSQVAGWDVGAPFRF